MSYIFESPDRGQTVYKREFGSTTRVLHSIADSVEEAKQEVKDAKLFKKIRLAAKTNKALQEALERVIIVYHLTEKDDGETS